MPQLHMAKPLRYPHERFQRCRGTKALIAPSSTTRLRGLSVRTLLSNSAYARLAAGLLFRDCRQLLLGFGVQFDVGDRKVLFQMPHRRRAGNQQNVGRGSS